MESPATQHTLNWIRSVVIGMNFCPFAARALARKGVRLVEVPPLPLEQCLEAFAAELRLLDEDDAVETTLLIFPGQFAGFDSYLDLVDLAEALLEDLDYEGIYQVASFHPEYCFEGAAADDPANYTNRSVYPMLHILREDSLTEALAHFADPEGIPERNVEFARQKGLAYMQMLLAHCTQ